MLRANKQRVLTVDEHLARARAASERARQALGTTQDKKETALADRPLHWWRERWEDEAIRRQFIETFIKVKDPRQKQKLVPLRFNTMQAEMWERATGHDVCLKMRRGGMSTFWLASFFANCVVNSGHSFCIVPQSPKTAKKLFSELKVMYRELPAHIRPATKQFSQEMIEFDDRPKGVVDTQISFYAVAPGHEDAARGDGYTELLITEMPFMRGDVQAALTSLIEAAEYGAVAIESTAQGVERFHQLYQEGKKSGGIWTSHFFPWWYRSDRKKRGARFHTVGANIYLLNWREEFPKASEPSFDSEQAAQFVHQARLTKRERAVAQRIFRHLRRLGELSGVGRDWIDNEVAEYLAWRREKIRSSGETLFLIEYPENDRECFEQTGRPVISAQWLKVTATPSEPLDGHEYLIAADCSLGLANGDPAAIQIIDLWHGRQVYEEELWLSPDLLGEKLAELSSRYNHAVIVVERNGPGIATLLKLQALGYAARLYKHLDAPLRRAVESGSKSIEQARSEAQYGFPTTAENKSLMGLRLEEAIRCGYLGLSSAAFCEQAKTVVWQNDKQWGALPGYHDDLFIALAIGNYVLRYEADMLPVFIGVEPEFSDFEF